MRAVFLSDRNYNCHFSDCGNDFNNIGLFCRDLFCISGLYENFEKEVSNGKVIITVSELSPFVLGIKEDANNNSTTTQQPTQNNNTTTTPTTNKGEKDNTPKTGTVDIINYVSIATLVSMVGIIVLKKKLK